MAVVQCSDDPIEGRQLFVYRSSQLLEGRQFGVGLIQLLLDHPGTTGQQGQQERQGTQDPKTQYFTHIYRQYSMNIYFYANIRRFFE